MDYQVSVSRNNNYITIKLNAPMTAELGRRCGTEAAELGEKHGISRYLFDLRGSPNVDSVQSNYEFAYSDMSDFGFPRGARSALLTDPGDETHDFLETLFLNAGYTVKVFHNIDLAMAWLKIEGSTD